jgi:hypothetical protein
MIMALFRYIFIFSFMAFAHISYADDMFGQRKANDGTYKIIPTSSPEACTALCQAETEHICRGHVFYQSDISKPEGECRLNSGIGENSAFQLVEPAPINVNIVIRDVNAYRAQYGLAPLSWKTELEDAAKVHTADLAFHGLIQHEGTDGSHHGIRIRRQGYLYSTALENVAAGQRSWEDALQGWKNSKGHNEALLSNEVTEFGVALEFNPATKLATYWTMVLAAPFGPQK